MRTAADNRAFRRRTGIDMPPPDAEDLEQLARIARGVKDGPYLTGPCIERLRFADFLRATTGGPNGIEFTVTEAGQAAIAGVEP